MIVFNNADDSTFQAADHDYMTVWSRFRNETSWMIERSYDAFYIHDCMDHLFDGSTTREYAVFPYGYNPNDPEYATRESCEWMLEVAE